MRPADARRARVMRQLALDGNELRRTSDRIERWCALALIIAYLPLAVLSAACAASLVRASAVRAQRDEPLRQVTAVLLRAVPTEYSAAAGSAVVWAKARWTVAGSTHVGNVPAIPGTPAGTAVRIWVDAAGKDQQPPPTSGQITAQVVAVLVAVPLGVGLGLWLAWYALRYLLDRHRMASWAQEWAALGPSWTR